MKKMTIEGEPKYDLVSMEDYYNAERKPEELTCLTGVDKVSIMSLLHRVKRDARGEYIEAAPSPLCAAAVTVEQLRTAPEDEQKEDIPVLCTASIETASITGGRRCGYGRYVVQLLYSSAARSFTMPKQHARIGMGNEVYHIAPGYVAQAPAGGVDYDQALQDIALGDDMFAKL